MTIASNQPRRNRNRGQAPVLFLAAAMALAGCASTRGLAPASAPLDADSLATGRSLDAQAAATFPSVEWWRAFQDPQLDALVDEALAGTPSLAAADARARQASAQAGLANAVRKPTLGASVRATGVQVPETLVEPPMGGDFNASTAVTLDFAYAPDLWGGQRAKYEAAVGEARAAAIDAQAARLALAANVASTYIALGAAFDALDAAEAEAARTGALAALEKQRVDAGIDNAGLLRQQQAAIASARQQAQAATQRIAALRNALAALLGAGPDRGLSIARPALDLAAPAVPDVLPSELLGHRPDVVAARWRVEAASRGIDNARAAFRPSVNLTALVGLAAPDLGDLFGSDALLAFGGPALSLPIFEGGALRAQLQDRNASYDLAVAAYDQALVGGLREVADAVQALRALDAQLASVDEARAAAAKAFEIASDRHRAGLGNRLDVLVVQQPLLQLDQQRASLRAQRLQAAVELDRALGGGLDFDAPPPSHVATRTNTP